MLHAKETENISPNTSNATGTEKDKRNAWHVKAHTGPVLLPSSNKLFKKFTPSQLVMGSLSCQLDMHHSRSSTPCTLALTDFDTCSSAMPKDDSETPLISACVDEACTENSLQMGTTAISESFSHSNAFTNEKSVIGRPSHRAPSRGKRKNIKILIIGNAKCGKSSLISKYAFGTFDEGYKTTIGADFVRKDLVYCRRGQTSADSTPPMDNEKCGERVRLQLWDIAGQDRFQKLTRAYFSNAKGVIIVCDVNRAGTLDAVKQWRREVSEWTANVSHLQQRPLPIVLFANKADTLQNAQEAFKLGGTIEKLCREEGILGWFITSARTGESVEDGFQTLLDEILKVPGPSQTDVSGESSSAAEEKNSAAGDTIRLTSPDLQAATNKYISDSCC